MPSTYEESRGARDRDDVEAPVAKDEATLELAKSVDVDDQFAAITVHSVAARTDLSDREFVCLALVAEFNGTTDGVRGARSTTACRGQETGTLDTLLGFVRVDRSRDERDIGHRGRAGRRPSVGAVKPAGVGRGGHDLVTVEELKKERLVRSPSVDHDPWSHAVRRAAVPVLRFGRGPRR